MKRLSFLPPSYIAPVLAIAMGLAAVTVSACTRTTASVEVADAPVSDRLTLAQHLTNVGARMYGAYWCPHCASQKELFGDAFSAIEYVECDPQGENAQPDLCAEREIRGYPTWEINGALYPGVRSLDVLADLSNYTGPRDFAP